MTNPSSPSASPLRRYALPLLLAYPVLAIAGALTHRPVFAVLALVLLITVLMLASLLSRRLGPWLLWLGLLLTVGLVSLYGFAESLLETVPVLINALLAYWFGRTLVTSEPLVARFVVALEGVERLQAPGVARYARQLTWFWALLLGSHAVLLAGLVLGAEHSGLLARFGVILPFPVPERFAVTWLHLGGYGLIGLTFVLEYAYRRWRLRHLSHPGLHQMLLQLAVRWPQLVRGKDPAAP